MPRQLLAFDLDHTLCRGNISYYFGAFLYRRKIFSKRLLVRFLKEYSAHRVLGSSMERMQQKIFKHLFCGRSAESFSYLAEIFIPEFFPRYIYQPAFSALLAAQSEGKMTAIFSSSPDFLVKPVAEHLAVDHWEASRYLKDEGEKYSHIENCLDGQGKALALKAYACSLGIGKEGITAFSDSHTDLPFLEAAGKAVAVRPTRALKKVCQQKGWSIL